MVKLSTLSDKAQAVLRTLCSNYRGSLRVKASFRCSVHYGLTKFIDDTKKELDELKAAKVILNYRIADEETDEDNDMCYFNVHSEMNLPIEQMAEIAQHSQTVFMP